MSQSHLDNLKVFGFGLALFIPLIVWLKHAEHKVGFLLFVIGIIGVLFILSKVNKIILPYLLVLGAVWGSILLGDHQPLGILAMSFLVLSIIILAVTFINANLLDIVYKYWMKGAHFIGVVITAVLLITFFYVVFGLAGIVLKLLRKDLLSEKLDQAAQSYWSKRTIDLDKNSYKRQF